MAEEDVVSYREDDSLFSLSLSLSFSLSRTKGGVPPPPPPLSSPVSFLRPHSQ